MFESLTEITNWELLIPFIVLDIIIKVIALTDFLRHREIRQTNWIWLFIILFISLLGPIIYFVFGRRD